MINRFITYSMVADGGLKYLRIANKASFISRCSVKYNFISYKSKQDQIYEKAIVICMWCNNRKYFAIGCLLSSNDNSSSAFFHSDCNRSHKRRNAAPAPVTKLRIQTTFGEKERAQTQTAFRRFFSLYARARSEPVSFNPIGSLSLIPPIISDEMESKETGFQLEKCRLTPGP